MYCHKGNTFSQRKHLHLHLHKFPIHFIGCFLMAYVTQAIFYLLTHCVKWTQGRRIYNIESRPIENAVEYGHVIEGFCQHISSKYRGFHLYNLVVHKDPDPTDFSFCERLMKMDMAVVKIEMATGSVIRCQFHQCPMSGFCASRFMLILLAHSVERTG